MAASDTPQDVIEAEPEWPVATGRPVVFLLDAAGRTEVRLLRDWLERTRPPDVDAAQIDVVDVPIVKLEKSGTVDPRLEARLSAGDDPLLVPMRIAWLPKEKNGERVARLTDLLTLNNPRHPAAFRKPFVARLHPDRRVVVVGKAAKASELHDRWRGIVESDASQLQGFAVFVARQAALALEVAERRMIGAQYKVPRLVRHEVEARMSFRTGLARLAHELGQSDVSVSGEADRDLREIAAGHSPYVIDLFADFGRMLYSGAYESAIDYERDQLERLRELGRRHPLVFLPTHKAYIDTLVLRQVMHETGLPPNHVASGINLGFFPLGTIGRRAGLFFIRRSFKDDHVYKFVLREYIAYLLEKRFSLEWFIEGGRSRSGKLLPPRLGLLVYVVDAYEQGAADDALLVPVSIIYDQITDVAGYAAEQRGARKRKESIGFFVEYIQKMQRRYGKVAIRFGEPVSLREEIGPPGRLAAMTGDERHIAINKLAFEVSVRINNATPIGSTALVTMAMLASSGRSMTVEQILQVLHDLLDYIAARKLPTTKDLDAGCSDGVRGTLELLMQHDVVTCFAKGSDAVYTIGPDQELEAAYYRNTIIHFFLYPAIAELAILAAGATKLDPVDVFWEVAMEVRDLLKFEFFFAPSDRFREEMAAEMTLHDPDWEERLAEHDRRQSLSMLESFRLILSPIVLRSFLEAYMVAAEALERAPLAGRLDESRFLDECMSYGKQYMLQRRISQAESNSRVLYANAYKLAQNRDLVEPGSPNLGDRRREFAIEMRRFVKGMEAFDTIAAARRVGLFQGVSAIERPWQAPTH